MKYLQILFLWCLCAGMASAQDQKIQAFALEDVELLESPFAHAAQIDMAYVLALDPDRLLMPFRREAGLDTLVSSYGNWENSGLDGHTAGHYLTTLSMMYASTKNQEVGRRLTYMLRELEKCQEKNGNGYIAGIPGGAAMWKDIADGKIDADNFSLNGKWVPWYNIHKLYAGLFDAYHYTGNQQAKEMLLKLTDWSMELVSGLSDAQIQEMLNTEYGGMNEVFANVAEITGEQKYLELAKKFSHRKILDPLLQERDVLTGLHANTQIPKVIGYKRVADVANDAAWNDAARFFWETVVENRTVAIGGNSVREHFHPTDAFSVMIAEREGPETCNTYNMLKLSKMLFLTSGSSKYVDYYERGLYNHILSSQHPEKGGFVYFTPMRPQHYRVYSQPENNFWCCVGSGMENHAKYGELIYAHTEDELYVNLFIPSKLTWKEREVAITQNTLFPEEEKTSLTIHTRKAQRFALKLRHPSWVARDKFTVTVNGKVENITSSPGSYVTINRKWKPGDEVVISLPMETAVEKLPDGSDYVAVLHGPIVLAAKTGTDDMDGLFADASRMGHIASGRSYPLDEAPLFVNNSEDLAAGIKPVAGKPLTFNASELIHPSHFQNLELIPFYKLHDARYMIYWQLTTPEGLEEINQKNRQEAKQRAELEAQTIDQVFPGEQQPESDHFFKGEQTETGVFKDRHWRHARKWFSYELKDENRQASRLRITYYGLDKGRNFDILINNTKIASVQLDGSGGDKFYTVDYKIPAEITKNAKGGVLETKFVAHEGSIAGGIYHVRLLRE